MEYLAGAGEHHRGGAGDALTQVTMLNILKVFVEGGGIPACLVWPRPSLSFDFRHFPHLYFTVLEYKQLSKYFACRILHCFTNRIDRDRP